MSNIYEIKTKTLYTLDLDLYKLKRRTDLLITATELKLDGRLTESYRDFYTYIYHGVCEIENLPYLISEKKFPQSHYTLNHPKRLDPIYFKKKYKEILDLGENLIKDAIFLNENAKENPSVLSSLAKEIDWEDWIEKLEDVNNNIDFNKGVILF